MHSPGVSNGKAGKHIDSYLLANAVWVNNGAAGG